MTQKANPSIRRPAEAFKTAGAIAYGGSVDGFVVDSANPTDISTQDAGIDETTFNSFGATTSTSSLTVNIDPGEGFVFGSWLAIDTQTTVSLDASTTGQTVYLGWNKDTSNDVIIGTDSSFATAQSDSDQRIPLYDFDTDSTGVTSETDRRQIGRAQDLAALSIADELDVPVYSDSSNAPQTQGNVISVDGSGTQTAGLYLHDGSSYVKAGNTEEKIEDTVAGLINSGTDIQVNYDDANDTLTINNTAGTDTRNAVNQLFIDNARQDFELGLSILDMDDGQFEVYANDNRIADQSNVNLNLGSTLSGKGTVSLASNTTSGFTEHDKEDYGFLPKSVWITDDIDTDPANGSVEYEIEDENGNIVTVTQSDTEASIDISNVIETYGVTTRAVLKRDTDGDTSPVLDAYSAYISGQKPDDYLDARVTSVSEV